MSKLRCKDCCENFSDCECGDHGKMVQEESKSRKNIVIASLEVKALDFKSAGGNFPKVLDGTDPLYDCQNCSNRSKDSAEFRAHHRECTKKKEGQEPMSKKKK